ncbi:hypothetical protein [Sphingomonas yabuuchiae]|uniref:Uncharacterized protein n=1 Tax=Sphingomonas yabuuchiae TaxID=172044 RepID=A0AA40ZZN3_9SPHN|nr:hypothetical protein [Sphingomonas yabuuchiae]MBB4610957.1 hypothetical protein [Sphingomonas yabuuchiae]MBN3557310.1 hypothetical protein [Sphingomonas yabuuchiae]
MYRWIKPTTGMENHMKRSLGLIGVGAIGCAVLGSSVAAGYMEKRFKPQAGTERSFGQGASPAQNMERRRGRAATIAVAEAAVR